MVSRLTPPLMIVRCTLTERPPHLVFWMMQPWMIRMSGLPMNICSMLFMHHFMSCANTRNACLIVLPDVSRLINI